MATKTITTKDGSEIRTHYGVDGKFRGLAVVGGLALADILLMLVVWAPMVVLLDPQLSTLSVGEFLAFYVTAVLSAPAVAFGYLHLTGRGIEFLDLRRPTVRDIEYTFAGSMILLGLAVFSLDIYAALGIPQAPADLYVEATSGRNAAAILLALIPLSLLVDPLVEFLRTGVVQKRLYENYSRMSAVLLASLVMLVGTLVGFAGPLTVANPNVMGILGVLIYVYAMNVIAGIAYERTDNLLVPMAITAVYNLSISVIVVLATI